MRFAKMVGMKATPSILASVALFSSTLFAYSTPEMVSTEPSNLSALIKMSLESDSGLADSKIEVRLENGIAVLTGTARTIDQSERAVDRAMAAIGVRGVVNQVRLVGDGGFGEALRSSVRKALDTNPAIDAKRITIHADGGRLVISGEVGTWDEQEIARETASQVAGVKEIENRTEVVFDSVRTDRQIEEQLGQMILNDPLYEGLSLSVSVKEGVVRLKGKVGSVGEYDRLVRRALVTGVFEVNADHLDVDSDLKSDVMGDKNFTPEETLATLGDAIEMDTRLDGSNIQFSIQDGVVILSGEVRNPQERAAAESTARGIPGILAIDNQLRIRPTGPQIVSASN